MNHVQKLLEDNNFFESANHLVDVEGMSTPRVCNLLNKLVASMDKEETYLEIGTWQGLTICSAAFGNEGKNCVACDKFRFLGKFTGWGFKVKKALYSNLEKYESKSAKVTFHHMLSMDLFKKGFVPNNVSVYFYDGDHTYQGTYENIFAVDDHLAAESVLLVDDWNDKVIQKATRDALEKMNVKIDWEIELEGKNQTQDGWWNGLAVFSLSRLNE